MARRLTYTEISRILDEDSNEIEDDMVFDESGAESDDVSVQYGADDTEEEVQVHNEPISDSDDEMFQPLSKFAHRSIYKGKDNTIWFRDPPSVRVRTRAENIFTGTPGVKLHARHAQQELIAFIY
ncbi:hypothetical protein HHI36_015776 [Cryptolaemus montrouzieri]|uniref:Uncharacterized protein n=1 Tax=Cryptolaemus montrouzieri TaxID=559131 RepID=A0ABD2N6M0_9CUCU